MSDRDADLAQRRKLEELERRLALLESVVHNTPTMLLRFDAQLRIQWMNWTQPPLGLSEVVGASLFDFIQPQDHDRVRQALEHLLKTGDPVRYETGGLGPDGRPAQYLSHAVRLVEDDGSYGGCLTIFDITSIVSRERRLADDELTLGVALEAVKLGRFSWDLRSNEVTWNARMYEILGQPAPVTLPEYLERIIHPEDRERVSRAGLERTFEELHRIYRPDGELRWVLVIGRTRYDADGRPEALYGGLLDVTDQRRLEEKVRHAQRIEALGTLATGIAHNFNNMLGVVLPTLELVSRSASGQSRELLDAAAGAARRAAEMVRKLMAFATPAPLAERVEVGALAKQVVEMCRSTFDPSVELECEVAPALPPAQAQAVDVEQVLMNLLVNARDAVSRPEVTSRRIHVHVDVPMDERLERRMIRLRVRDEGVGMSARIVEHAFDPFFTTKPLSEGTGLGLATSYAIVRELGGTIGIDSREGQGTTMTVLFPAALEAATTPEPPGPTSAPRQARVLVIDDEDGLRRIVAEALSEAGYVVDSANGGVQGLERAAAAAPDLVLVDRSMPGLGGRGLIDRLRATSPHARIVFFTGHDVGPEESRWVDGVIHKPVSLDALLAQVETHLREPPTGG